VNLAPVAVADVYSTDEDNTLIVPAASGVLANDYDPLDDNLTAVLLKLPLNATLTLNTDGSFIYDPYDDFNGSDWFSYKANDGLLDSGETSVTITVNAVNDAPVLGDIPDQTVVQGTSFSVIDLNAWVTHADGDQVSWSYSDNVTLSVIIANGIANVTYPDYWLGKETITFTASDGELSDSDNVTFSVIAFVQPPDFTNENSTTFTVGQFGSFAMTVSGNPKPTFHLVGSIPAGVLFDGIGGLLSGIPENGTGGIYALTLTADNGASSDSTQNFTLTVNESPEITSHPSDQTVIAGKTARFTASASGYPALTVHWELLVPGGNWADVLGANAESFEFTTHAGDSGKVFRAVFSNDIGSPAISRSAALTVNYPLPDNKPPIVVAGSDATLNEGDTFRWTGSFSDADSNFWIGAVDYGDGSGLQSLPLLADKTYVLSHVYTENGVYLVTVTVTDDLNAAGSVRLQLTVNNVAPSVKVGADASVDLGKTFSSSGSFTDPGSDTWTAIVDYGDGSGSQALTLTSKTFLLSHFYLAIGSYIVNVIVRDDDGGEAGVRLVVNVRNPSASSETSRPTSIPLNLQSDLVITQTGNAASDGSGETFIYELHIDNSGTDTATGVEVIITLADMVSLVSSTCEGWALSQTGQILSFTRMTSLPLGEAPPITIRVTAAAVNTSLFQAIIKGDQIDTNQTNNTVSGTIIKSQPPVISDTPVFVPTLNSSPTQVSVNWWPIISIAIIAVVLFWFILFALRMRHKKLEKK
jgi:hypothetical protein